MGAHRTTTERKAIIARYRRSGLTQREFCEAEGITLGALQSWLYKRSRKPAEAPRFIELTRSSAAEAAAIELHLEVLRVVLPTTFSDERIAGLAVALLHGARAAGPRPGAAVR